MMGMNGRQEEEPEHHNPAIFPRSTYSTYYQVRVDLYVSLQTKLPVCSVLLLAAGSKYLGQSDLVPHCSKNVQGNAIQDTALII